MNVPLWIIAGGVLGWLLRSKMGLDATRGAFAVLVGAVGGFVGGNVLAPMLGAATDAPNEFNVFSMVVAVASAAACLTVAGLLHRRRQA